MPLLSLSAFSRNITRRRLLGPHPAQLIVQRWHSNSGSDLAEGILSRRTRLHEALEAEGVDVHDLLKAAEHIGSAALRTYTSFVHPRNLASFADAERPHRAASIAKDIAFTLREARATRDMWLRNHDRALEDLPPSTAATPLSLVLDNLRSAENVGSIFRAAEAAGLAHVYCCGITPVPPHSRLLKTALGSAERVRHSHRPTTLPLVRELRARGVTVWAAETTARSRLYTALPMPSPLALVLGNESIGVDPHVLDEVDAVAELPMLGVKNSLNVATACTVLLWEALRQWKLGQGGSG